MAALAVLLRLVSVSAGWCWSSGVVVALAGLTGVLVGHVGEQARVAARQGADDFTRGQIPADTPEDSLADLMRGIARSDGDGACAAQFTEDGRRAFADAYGQSDCAAALHAVGARIGEPDRYRDPIDTASIAVTLRPDGLADVDGCAVRWRGRGLEFLTGPTPPQPDPGPPWPGHDGIRLQRRGLADHRLPPLLTGVTLPDPSRGCGPGGAGLRAADDDPGRRRRGMLWIGHRLTVDLDARGAQVRLCALVGDPGGPQPVQHGPVLRGVV